MQELGSRADWKIVETISGINKLWSTARYKSDSELTWKKAKERISTKESIWFEDT